MRLVHLVTLVGQLVGQPVGAGVPPRPADGPPGLVAKAYAAAEERRYCDAVPLFLALHERAPQAKLLYRAAEVAYAAGDLPWAQDLYRSVQESYPTFEKAAAVTARLRELGLRLKREETITACAPAPTVCGDWIIRPGEQCDDGNLDDGDGCDGNCSLSACGNGRKAHNEECDDGNLDDGDGCDGTCTLTRCGNGIVTAGEACDDGNAVNGDGCDRNCTLSVCGNGARDPREECDDGNTIDGDGCDRGCVASRCGNGVIAGGETCDDGNTDAGDTCDAACGATSSLLRAEATAHDGSGSARREQQAPFRAQHWLLVGGGVGVAAGAAALIVGALPLVQHRSAVEGIRAAEARADADPARALTDARALQRDAQDANDAWQTWGAPMFIAGIAAVAGGVVLLGIGAASALATEDTPPPSSSADEERLP